MTKNLLTYLSHNFCINCCGEHCKLDCDAKNYTCNRLAQFLIGCNLYKESVSEEELDRLANSASNELYSGFEQTKCIWKSGFKVGFRKVLEYINSNKK